MSASEIHGPQYRIQSVRVEKRDGSWCMVDGSYAGAEHVTPYGSSDIDRVRAHTAVRGRQATIKGALTRRRNKRIAQRATALDAAGVTWSWLTKDMTPAEADAWLGLD